MLTAERTCPACDGTLSVRHIQWIEWYMDVAIGRGKGLTEMESQKRAGDPPDVPEYVVCPMCGDSYAAEAVLGLGNQRG